MNDEIIINIANKCNLSCIYCTSNMFRQSDDNDDKDNENHENVVCVQEHMHLCKDAYDKGVRRFILTGGEPLLNDGLEELISYIKSLGNTTKVILVSNGTVLADRMDKLIDVGIDEIHINMDAANSYEYRRIAGFDHMNEVLCSVWKSASLKIPTVLHCTLIDQIKDNVPVLAGLAKTLNIDVCFQSLSQYPYGINDFPEREAIKQLQRIYSDFSEVDDKENENLRCFKSSKLRGRILFKQKKEYPLCCRPTSLSCKEIIA